MYILIFKQINVFVLGIPIPRTTTVIIVIRVLCVHLGARDIFSSTPRNNSNPVDFAARSFPDMTTRKGMRWRCTVFLMTKPLKLHSFNKRNDPLRFPSFKYLIKILILFLIAHNFFVGCKVINHFTCGFIS